MEKKFGLILTVPRVGAIRPAIAPAIIKGILEREGKSSKIYDINLDFHSTFRDGTYDDLYYKIDQYFFDSQVELTSEERVVYSVWMTNWVTKLKQHDPEYLFISVFSHHAQVFVSDFLPLVRAQMPDVQIIIGGQGLVVQEHGTYATRLPWPEKLKEDGLINHWVRGEAETTIARLIRGEFNIKGVDTAELADMSPLGTQPYMDFTDFDIKGYFSGFENGCLPIESSRGCIRKCSFCDIPTMYNGYRYKKGQQLFDEMIHYYETYNVSTFYFNDSLCNGSLRDFRIFNELLSQYYKDNNLPQGYFTYSSHYIIRSIKNTKESDFANMAAAGAETMVIGVETGSDRVRGHMSKEFNNEDLDYTLEMFSKYRISMYMLIIIGWPTETRDDFEQTLDMLTRYQKYVADGTIVGVNLGTTLTIEEGTPLFDQCEKYNIVGKDGNVPQGPDWMCLDNPSLTYKERIKRRVEAQELAVKLGYTFWKGDDQLRVLMDRYKTRLSKLDSIAGMVH